MEEAEHGDLVPFLNMAIYSSTLPLSAILLMENASVAAASAVLFHAEYFFFSFFSKANEKWMRKQYLLFHLS